MSATETTLQTALRRHSFAQTLTYHLVPGIVITLAFVSLTWLTRPMGWPASLALLVTWLIAGIPVLLGILFVQGWQLNGKLSLNGLLLYRQSLSIRHFLWLVPVLLIWTAFAATLLFPLGESIRLGVFADWPDWLNLSTFAQNPTAYPNSILWAIVALSAVLNIAVPITEELYFRSFLLPRLPVSTKWAPLLNTILFSIYHFWLPWDIIGRLITLLPVVYAVQWKRNVYVSILVHCLLNSFGTLGLIAIVMGAG